MVKTHILTLVDHRYREQPQPSGMVAALRDRGADVTVVDDTQVTETDWSGALSTAKVVVARGRRPGTLAALRLAQQAGLPVVDTAAAVEGVRDKRLMTRTLLEAGLPTPRTILGTITDIVSSDLVFPVILKPIFGDNSSGLTIVHDRADLTRISWQEDELLAQEYHRNPGVDLKLYVIDGCITAIRKPSPITPCQSKHLGVTPVVSKLRDIVHRCSDAFGLRFFGVDCLETDEQAIVLEVNDFPNYSCVPFASELLALQVLRVAAA